MATVAQYLAEFIRDKESELESSTNCHLFNFHARIYHTILQLIDSSHYVRTPPMDTQPQVLPSFPVSLTMSIDQLSTILDEVERDVLQQFDYNTELRPLIHAFFKLLRLKMDRYLARNRDEKKNGGHSQTNGTHKKRRKLSSSSSHSTSNSNGTHSPPHHNFGPYTRKHFLRDDDAREREQSGDLRFCLIYNDESKQSCGKLFELKEIFHECLPAMPKNYISRIVMDKQHRSIVAVMNANVSGNAMAADASTATATASSTHEHEPIGVFGGVSFRPFPERNFAEVVFLAIAQNHQIKGFGTRLMNHLKQSLKRMGIYHIITFADNNAIDYFAKQGFAVRTDLIDEVGNILVTKSSVSSAGIRTAAAVDDVGDARAQNCHNMDALYGCDALDFHDVIYGENKGYIKIYNGATLMHARVIKHVDYCQLDQHLIANRKLMLEKIAQISDSVVSRPGFDTPHQIIDLSQIPGISADDIKHARSNLFAVERPTQVMMDINAKISGILKQLHNHPKSSVFAKPVDLVQAPLYDQVVKNAMDLSRIQSKLNNYEYTSMRQFINDFKLIITNCKLFNPPTNIYHIHAIQFDEYFEKLLQQF